MIWVSLITGALSGAMAIALHEGVDLGTQWFLGLSGFHPSTVAGDPGGAHPAQWLSGGGRWLVPLITALGALAATTLVYAVAPETHGHGTDNAIEAIHANPRGIRARTWPIRLIASVLTLGSGGSGGTEGPTAQMAASTASALARWLKLDDAQARKTVTAGLAAGVGAIFRAPLGGALLGVELLYREDGDFSMLVPSMIASFVSYLEFGAVFGYSPMFGQHAGLGLHLSPQLAAFPVLGICAGLLARLFCQLFYALSGWFEKWQGPRPLRAAAAGLAVGLIGLLIPGVWGTGYGTIQDVMGGQYITSVPLIILIAMPFAKLAATSLTVGSGGSGGVFGPGLVIGAATGAALWRLAEPLGLAPASPVSMVVIGMAACLGAATHAPVSITIIAAEMCGSMSVLEPAAIAVPLAVLVIGDRTLYRSQRRNRSDPGPVDPMGEEDGPPPDSPEPRPDFGLEYGQRPVSLLESRRGFPEIPPSIVRLMPSRMPARRNRR